MIERNTPADRLAGALSSRLDAVAPRPVRIRAEGCAVAVYVGDEWWVSVVGGELTAHPEMDVEGEPWTLEERIETAARAVLSTVQDVVAESTREPWPRLPTGAMALPGARAEAGQIHLWYGPTETEAVLRLMPLVLDDLRADVT